MINKPTYLSRELKKSLRKRTLAHLNINLSYSGQRLTHVSQIRTISLKPSNKLKIRFSFEKRYFYIQYTCSNLQTHCGTGLAQDFSTSGLSQPPKSFGHLWQYSYIFGHLRKSGYSEDNNLTYFDYLFSKELVGIPDSNHRIMLNTDKVI